MCGRYVIEDFQELSETLRDLPFQSFIDFTPNWNAAPSQQLPVLIEHNGTFQLRDMRWGLIPGWLKPGDKPKVTPINARVETVAEKPMFRNLVRTHRCIVPTNGFYEWKQTGGSRQPYFIHLSQQPMMLMAGLYDVRSEDDGTRSGSYTIMTGEANSAIDHLHHRMPLMIRPEDIVHWLDPDITVFDPLVPLLDPPPAEEFALYPVSTAVNSVRNNSPDLLEPIATQDELFS